MRVTDDELRRLQDAHGRDLLTYIARRMETPADSAAVLNEVLEVMWRRARQVPSDPEQARMWMFGVAAKLCANHRRSSRRRLALTARLAEELSAGATEVVTDEVLDVRAALRALPAKDREIIRLVHWDGFSLEEAAQILHIPPSTARGRYQAAKARLAKSLQMVTPTTHNQRISQTSGRA